MKPRRAQEDHTHAGLTGAGTGGINGVYSAWYPTDTSNTAAGIGHSVTANGTAVGVTIDFSTTPIRATLRCSRRASSSSTHGYLGSTTRWVNTVRGFWMQWVFGTQGDRSAALLFAGLCRTAPTGTQTNFAGWASLGAVGVLVEKDSTDIVWAARSDASTTWTSSTGLTWADGEIYKLELEAAAGSGDIVATLSCSNGDTATTTIAAADAPDANTTPTHLLGPLIAAFYHATDTSPDIVGIRWDCVEPW